MGASTLGTFRSNIRVALADTSETFWTSTELDRGTERAERLLSRLIPKKNIVETTITVAVTGETLTIASNTGTIANLPVKYSSETITNPDGTTVEVRDTDYTINYMTGVVTEIGALLADGAYTIAYSVDPKRLDTSTLVTDPVKITRIEYPIGNQPPTYLGSYDVIEDYIILHGDTILTAGRHLRIYYDSQWRLATQTVEGEYPSHLDEAIVLGSTGYALLTKAEKYVQQSITELELVNAAADSMGTPLADINTALDKVATYLETNETTGSADDANSRAILELVKDNIADLRTAIETALDEAANLLVHASTDPSAKYYLTQGDATIPTLNVADNVPENYANYARTSIQIYNSLVAEANIRLSNLRSIIEEAAGWTELGDTFIKEATQRIAEANAWAVQADRYRATSQEYLNIAGRYLASGQSKINEFYALLGVKPELQHTQSSASQATRY